MTSVAGKEKKGGRTTPKKVTPSADDGKARTSYRRPKPDPDSATPQIGKRPSPPALLFAIAGMWALAGAYIWLSFTASWKLIPAIFAVGIGGFFLRGALQTVVRHDERLDGDDN